MTNHLTTKVGLATLNIQSPNAQHHQHVTKNQSNVILFFSGICTSIFKFRHADSYVINLHYWDGCGF